MLVDVNKVKVIVFVPRSHTEIVKDAMSECGAGVIGNYSHCFSSHKTKGEFMPNNLASPYIGKLQKLEKVKEDRVEAVCNIENVKSVVLNIKKVHPYEEPEIDIIPLIDEKSL